MKKINLIVVFILCISVLLGCAPITKDVLNRYEKNKYVYLVAGFDDAAENTDVLFTLSYDIDTGIGRVAQIPRDTYFGFGKIQNKINQLYASKVSEGMSSESALENVSAEIAAAFGTKFDGYIGVTIATFKNMVDAIGGLDIELSEDMTFFLDSDDNPLVLKKGRNHIDGNCAERFVRFRSGYAMGDLGRVDAQKIFLNALFSKLISGVSLPELIKLVRAFENDVVTNIKFSNVINIFVAAMNSKVEKKAFYATVPGDPVQSTNGLSFYVLNRKSAAELASKYMFATDEFDRNKVFLNTAEESFANIYEDDTIKIIEYTKENISKMHIISG